MGSNLSGPVQFALSGYKEQTKSQSLHNLKHLSHGYDLFALWLQLVLCTHVYLLKPICRYFTF